MNQERFLEKKRKKKKGKTVDQNQLQRITRIHETIKTVLMPFDH